MADAEHQDLIIIKRYEEEEHEAHSSAWKVAHADFMTAMMAFFLIMWLINATDDEVKKSIANYFNPVNLAESMTDRKGLHDPEDVEPAPPPEAGKHGDAGGAASERPAAIAVVMAEREQAAFQDPYAILAKLAAEATEAAPEAADIDAPEIQTGEPGDPGGDTARDPFDPVYWQTNATRQSRTDKPGKSGTIANARIGAEIDAAARASDAPVPGADGKAGEPGSEPPAAEAASAAAGEAAGPDAFANQAYEGGADATAGSGPHLEIRQTSEGTLVSLTDDINFSMFAVGSAIPAPQTVKAMEEIAKALSTRSGEIVVRGYTDARPFRSETYDNWRLSTARAHMAQYMLVRGGLQEERIRSVEGFADRDLKNARDPNAAENRRIEILLRAPAAEAPR